MLYHVIILDLFIEFACFHSGVRFKESFSMKNVCLHMGFTYLHILLYAYGEHICVTNVPHCWWDRNRRRNCHTFNNIAEDKRKILYWVFSKGHLTGTSNDTGQWAVGLFNGLLTRFLLFKYSHPCPLSLFFQNIQTLNVMKHLRHFYEILDELDLFFWGWLFTWLGSLQQCFFFTSVSNSKLQFSQLLSLSITRFVFNTFKKNLNCVILSFLEDDDATWTEKPHFLELNGCF